MALAIRRQRRIWIAGMCAAAAVAMAIWAPLFLTATSGPLELEDATASTFSQWLQNGSCLPSIWSDPQNLLKIAELASREHCHQGMPMTTEDDESTPHDPQPATPPRAPEAPLPLGTPPPRKWPPKTTGWLAGTLIIGALIGAGVDLGIPFSPPAVACAHPAGVTQSDARTTSARHGDRQGTFCRAGSDSA